MPTELVNVARNLPMTLTGDVEKLGYKFLRALDRLGFVHQTQDGRVTSVRFASVMSYGARWAAYQLDVERLYHWSVRDLTAQRVIAQLNAISQQAGHGPVRVDEKLGVYVVEMQKRAARKQAPAAELDLRVNFDLSQMPQGTLMIPIGQTDHGKRFEPLKRVKHMMVIGESGSGKSNYLKTVLTALVKTTTADEIRIAMVSPKQSEFGAFAGVPHVWKSAAWDGHIACEAEEADKLILDLRNEFKRRDRLFSASGVTNVDDYNDRAGGKLPRVLVMVDELLDLAEMAKPAMKERMMGHLASLLSIGRSHGFHIFIGITKPHFKTLPTSITGNIDNRIAFRVATDRVARDFELPGAETIPEEAAGRGLARLYGQLFFFQAFLVSDADQASNDEPVPVGRDERLTEDEAALVAYALDECEGEFVVNQVWNQFKPAWSHHRVDKLARRLETDGLLIASSNPSKGRMVTMELERMARSFDAVHEAVHEPCDDEYARLFKAKPYTSKA